MDRKLSKEIGTDSEVDCIMKPGGSFNDINIFKMFLVAPLILLNNLA